MILNEWIVKAKDSTLELIKKYDKGLEIIPDITSVCFIDIKKNIPELISEGKFEESISLISKQSIKEILKIEELDRFRMLIWIEKQYDNINRIEKQYLERVPEFKLIAAGIKNLDVLGHLNTTVMLSKEYGYKIEEIEQLPYSRCFELQLKSVIESDIQKKLIEHNKNNGKK